MLTRLYIRNFGLIDRIEQSFDSGLNIITGETGTGKSMIMGALGLIFGDRADNKVLKNQEVKCILEAEFSKENRLIPFFEENDLDWNQIILIRREISSQGRSRAFINDTPVKIELLKKLNAELIDIHTQDQTQKISQPDYQLELLDLFANTKKTGSKYTFSFDTFNRLKDELHQLKMQIEKDKNEYDLLSFQSNELREAQLKKGEIAKLEQERDLLLNQDAILQALEQGKYILNDEEPSVLDKILLLKKQFESLKDVSDWLKAYFDRISEVYNELKDINYEFESRVEDAEIELGGLEKVEQRIAVYYHLESKYNLHGEKELIDYQTRIDNRLALIENSDNELADRKAELKSAKEKVIEIGEELNKQREKAARKFENSIEKQLKDLGIQYPLIKFNFDRLIEPGPMGLFDVEMLFSSNPDSVPASIEKVASGGEKSRLMLGLKSILGNKLKVGAIVFDEIDTGISGEIAIKTGQLLEKLSRDTQVISITHLPQVASKGRNHFKVEKKVLKGKTSIGIIKLNHNERIEELAEMLSGKKITESARKIASELLDFSAS